VPPPPTPEKAIDIHDQLQKVSKTLSAIKNRPAETVDTTEAWLDWDAKTETDRSPCISLRRFPYIGTACTSPTVLTPSSTSGESEVGTQNVKEM